MFLHYYSLFVVFLFFCSVTHVLLYLNGNVLDWFHLTSTITFLISNTLQSFIGKLVEHWRKTGFADWMSLFLKTSNYGKMLSLLHYTLRSICDVSHEYHPYIYISIYRDGYINVHCLKERLLIHEKRFCSLINRDSNFLINYKLG